MFIVRLAATFNQPVDELLFRTREEAENFAMYSTHREASIEYVGKHVDDMRAVDMPGAIWERALIFDGPAHLADYSVEREADRILGMMHNNPAGVRNLIDDLMSF